jgi:hypothetical protein
MGVEPKNTAVGGVLATERTKVESWRLHVLVAAGYPVALAELLAASEADLHQCEQILRRGCSPTVAVKILL